jgi:hypothetical protein
MNDELEDFKPKNRMKVLVIALANGIFSLALRYWPGNVDKTEARLLLDYWWLFLAVLIIDIALVIPIIVDEYRSN